MSRPRNEYLLVELARLPWWVSVIFAVVVFALLRWGVPALTASRPIPASSGPAVSGNAWWIAAIFVADFKLECIDIN